MLPFFARLHWSGSGYGRNVISKSSSGLIHDGRIICSSRNKLESSCWRRDVNVTSRDGPVPEAMFLISTRIRKDASKMRARRVPQSHSHSRNVILMLQRAIIGMYILAIHPRRPCALRSYLPLLGQFTSIASSIRRHHHLTSTGANIEVGSILLHSFYADVACLGINVTSNKQSFTYCSRCDAGLHP